MLPGGSSGETVLQSRSARTARIEMILAPASNNSGEVAVRKDRED